MADFGGADLWVRGGSGGGAVCLCSLPGLVFCFVFLFAGDWRCRRLSGEELVLDDGLVGWRWGR